MTEILRRSPPQQLTSSSSSVTCITPTYNQGLPQNHEPLLNSSGPAALYRRRNCRSTQTQVAEEDQLSVFVTILRKSLVGCSNTSGVIEEELNMEIGSPTNVRHVAHVTFDRFNGFLGLPVEFEPDVPRRPPSASTRVFGVSTDSMQLSFDTRGNCVPTILLMMQRRLYSQGGLQSEGIFRINPANGQEEYVREQLNNGLIPDNIDVHCLAGLIKAWFRELPRGILDCLSPEQVMQAQSEDDCTHLVTLLPQTEAALLDWAVNLMADVAQLEHLNKMNARNIAMVFAPNMTQMSDPMTALMHAVQVMNFLKTLIVKILREREDSVVEVGPSTQIEPSDEEDSHYSISKPINLEEYKECDEEEEDNFAKELESNEAESKSGSDTHGSLNSTESILPDDQKGSTADIQKPHGTLNDGLDAGNGRTQSRNRRVKTGQRSNSNNAKRGSRKHIPRPVIHVNEKKKETNISSCVNSQTQRGEAWR